MVAFVNDKFINMSAHTSYLYLVKEPDHISVIHNRAHFVTGPAHKRHGLTLSDRRAGRFKLQNLHPVLDGRPLYIDDENSVNDKPVNAYIYFLAAGCLADESAVQETHYRR